MLVTAWCHKITLGYKYDTCIYECLSTCLMLSLIAMNQCIYQDLSDPPIDPMHL